MEKKIFGIKLPRILPDGDFSVFNRAMSFVKNNKDKQKKSTEIDNWHWNDALRDPNTKAALDEGLKDMEEGRVRAVIFKSPRDTISRGINS
jgi:hypothetical protein